MRAFKRDDKKYLIDQSKLDALIKAIVAESGEDLEGFGHGDTQPEAIECMSRDGFWAASDNCGGYTFTEFTDVRSVWGSGMPTSKEAAAAITKQYEASEEYAREDLKGEFEALKIPLDKQNYHDLYELEHGELAERFDEKVTELASEDTIMLQTRILYCGVEDGVHVAFVSATVNWEAPYHRSHISWMPGFKCEASKEVRVTFKGLRDGKAKLNAAMLKAKKAIF